MDKKTEEIFEAFQNALDDNLMSRKERRSIDELFEITKPGRHEKHILRSKLFELAKERANEGNTSTVFNWLEDAMKLLIEDRNNEGAESVNEVVFSPGYDCKDLIIREIKSAKKNLRICVFTISDDDIANEIIDAKKRGVDIKVISDDDKQFDLGSDIEKLKSKGVPVRVDNTPNHMHNKFMTIDSTRCLTGSYNWTRSAARYNQENVLFTKELSSVRAFEVEFNRLWHQFK